MAVCSLSPGHPQLNDVGQLAANNRRRKDIFTLSREDQALIEQLGYKQKLAEVDDAILANAAFLNRIVANPEIFENSPGEDQGEEVGEEGLDESEARARDELDGLRAKR
jgi:carnosine N-methyltransferase